MSCFCPPLYTPDPTGTFCIGPTQTIPATPSGGSTYSALPVSGCPADFRDAEWNSMGVIVYEDITNLPKPIKSYSVADSPFYTPAFVVSTRGNPGHTLSRCCFFSHSGSPLSNETSTILRHQLGGPGKGYVQGGGTNFNNPPNFYGPPIVEGNNFLWGKNNNGNNKTFGRLNNVGIWNGSLSLNIWYGFTSCITLDSTQTIYIGLSADNNFRFKINDELVVESIDTEWLPFLNQLWAYNQTFATNDFNYGHYHVFPYTLQAGTYIISMEALDRGQPGGMVAEIYTGITNVNDFSTINESTLSGKTLFSTLNQIGLPFTVGQWTCPNDFILNTCDGSPSCSFTPTAPCAFPPPTTTTTTTIRTYINTGYIPVNDCDVLTILPLNVQCEVTNITGKPDSSNGSITLNITGGVPPYTIRWTYPNGAVRVGGDSIGGLSTGTYVATVTDYYGDYTFTTSCTVPGITTTTTSTTTLPPIPNYLENIFCLSLEFIYGKGIVSQIGLTFQLDTYINGFPSWVSETGEEIVYFNPSQGTSGLWVLSASTLSTLNSPQYFNSTQPNWQVFNSSPIAPIPGVSPNYVGWGVVSSANVQSINSSKGVCGKYLLLTINEWWALNYTEIPTTFKFFGGSCNGSNRTPWFKWYLLGGLNSSDVSSYEIYCEDLDNPGYVHWDVTNIDITQTEVSSSIPWIGTPMINPTTGDPGASNNRGWEGPCPPPSNTHTYQVTLTANLVAGGTITSSLTFYSTTP